MTRVELTGRHAARGAGGARWRGSGVATQIGCLTLRSLRAVVLDPRLIAASVLSPLLMLVLFSQVFASLAKAPSFPAGVSYLDFLVPAIMVTTAAQSAINTGSGLTREMSNGIITRFRAMPIWLGSVLLARALSDLIRSAAQLLLLLGAAALLLGFRPPGGAIGLVEAWGLAVVVGGCLGWVFIALACWVRDPEALQHISALVALPLLFVSDAFVPTAALPGWLRLPAKLNPMTYGIDAARDLTLARPVGAGLLAAVGTGAALAVLAAVVAVRGFRRVP